jgi:tetratricopeptide (TPR) repeat protein
MAKKRRPPQLQGPVNFFDKRDVATLAELEGQIGLNLIRSGDEQGAEDHYRSARHFAEEAEDWSAVNTWATNIGNACARRGRYGEAVKNYDRALAAAVKCASGNEVYYAAGKLADCLSAAYRHEEAADRMRALAAEQSDERFGVAMLDRALELYDRGMCAAKAIDTAQAIEGWPASPAWQLNFSIVSGRFARSSSSWSRKIPHRPMDRRSSICCCQNS